MKINNKEFAVQMNGFPKWDIGAPMPRIYFAGIHLFLSYFPAKSEEDKITNCIALDSENDHPKFYQIVVEFKGVNSYRLLGVNDEVSHGHPLYKKGLRLYEAHIIENSSWINELNKIHQVHQDYNHEHWRSLKHYLLYFHDEMIEVVTRDFKVKTYYASTLALSQLINQQIETSLFSE